MIGSDTCLNFVFPFHNYVLKCDEKGGKSVLFWKEFRGTSQTFFLEIFQSHFFARVHEWKKYSKKTGPEEAPRFPLLLPNGYRYLHANTIVSTSTKYDIYFALGIDIVIFITAYKLYEYKQWQYLRIYGHDTVNLLFLDFSVHPIALASR